jgi:hypothetical protein
MRKNDLIEPENYLDGYKQSMEEHKGDSDATRLDKLCYQVFNKSPEGKLLLEYLKERFIVPAFVPVGAPSYSEQVIFYEGFKEAYRLIFRSIESHQQRINAEDKSNV